MTEVSSAASCSCVGQPQIVCWSSVNSVLRQDSMDINEDRTADRIGLNKMNSVSLFAKYSCIFLWVSGTRDLIRR